MTGEFNVKKDPRFDASDDILKANLDFDTKVGELSETATKIFKQIETTLNEIKTFDELADNIDSTKSKALKKQGSELKKKLVTLMNKITPDWTQTG